jgi:hypothetical protein
MNYATKHIKVKRMDFLNSESKNVDWPALYSIQPRVKGLCRLWESIKFGIKVTQNAVREIQNSSIWNARTVLWH